MKKKIRLVRQLGVSDCGVACLVMLLKFFKLNVSLADIQSVFPVGRDGMSLLQMKKISEFHNFSFHAYQYNYSENNIINNLPVIMCTKENHYVVISNKNKKGYEILDPTKGKEIVQFEDLKKRFLNVIVVIRPVKVSEKEKYKIKRHFKIHINYKKLTCGVCFTALSQFIILSISMIIQKVVDKIIGNDKNFQAMYFLILALIIAVAYFIIGSIKQYVTLLLETEIYTDTIKKLINKVFHIDVSFYVSHTSGDIANRISNVTSLFNFLANTSITILINLITAFICAIAMLILSLKLFCVVALITFIQVIVVSFFYQKQRQKTEEYYYEQSILEGDLINCLTNILSIKCMGIENKLQNMLQDRYTTLINILKSKTNYSNAVTNIVESIGLVSNLIFYAIGGIFVMNRNFTMGTLLAFITLSEYFIKPIQSVAVILPQMTDLKETLNRIQELMDFKDYKSIGKQPVKHFDTMSLKSVSYQYPSASKANLNNINIDIKKGQRIAIVGPSGSGKTTITKMMLNMAAPTNGNIYVNGIDMLNIDKNDFCKLFSVVTQTPFVINGTIRQNIDLLNILSEKDIIDVLELVELADDIKLLPLGLETRIGENGQNISGGQKQRIAIARALAVKSEVIIFDEATSNLDSITEQKIFENLKKSNLTQIIITHRLNTIRDADDIYVVENGEIIEQGKHISLIKSEGFYYNNTITSYT